MIHQYKLNGVNIVLDTFSGAVHVVDDLSYDIIELYDQKKEKEAKAEADKAVAEVAEKPAEEVKAD